MIGDVTCLPSESRMRTNNARVVFTVLRFLARAPELYFVHLNRPSFACIFIWMAVPGTAAARSGKKMQATNRDLLPYPIWNVEIPGKFVVYKMCTPECYIHKQ